MTCSHTRPACIQARPPAPPPHYRLAEEEAVALDRVAGIFQPCLLIVCPLLQEGHKGA